MTPDEATKLLEEGLAAAKRRSVRTSSQVETLQDQVRALEERVRRLEDAQDGSEGEDA